MVDRMQLQKNEFDKLDELTKQNERLNNVSVIDDEYPRCRHLYETALKDFIEALIANGRFTAQNLSGDLTFDSFAKTSLQRSVRWHHGSINEWSIADWAVAAAGEMGEICNAIKKLNRVTHGDANMNEPGRFIGDVNHAMQKVGDEIADTISYLFLLAARCDINVETVLKKKFNEVSEKYGFPERL